MTTWLFSFWAILRWNNERFLLKFLVGRFEMKLRKILYGFFRWAKLSKESQLTAGRWNWKNKTNGFLVIRGRPNKTWHFLILFWNPHCDILCITGHEVWNELEWKSILKPTLALLNITFTSKIIIIGNKKVHSTLCRPPPSYSASYYLNGP